ncbi:hypothetical protein [Oceanirhabdus seepicola]|uniref:Uncharacterized protein n=1 Tax=Oceanirhabdus seepicola TaxID=2828781 RepID=A0A9J6P2J3_9CLOT|nr:hypothetical protein [Oceanirhabdus seepicola]MCM1990281.1 hypothetical protein [Oceanirhabdus seepicola]
MNKKIIIGVLTLILIIGGAVFGIVKNQEKKSTPDNNYITVEYRDAMLGSLLTANLTEEGKEKYSNASLYEVYDEKGEVMSPDKLGLGKETVVLPKTKPGENVVIYLYDEAGELLDKLTSRVIK